MVESYVRCNSDINVQVYQAVGFIDERVSLCHATAIGWILNAKKRHLLAVHHLTPLGVGSNGVQRREVGGRG